MDVDTSSKRRRSSSQTVPSIANTTPTKSQDDHPQEAPCKLSDTGTDSPVTPPPLEGRIKIPGLADIKLTILNHKSLVRNHLEESSTIRGQAALSVQLSTIQIFNQIHPWEAAADGCVAELTSQSISLDSRQSALVQREDLVSEREQELAEREQRLSLNDEAFKKMHKALKTRDWSVTLEQVRRALTTQSENLTTLKTKLDAQSESMEGLKSTLTRDARLVVWEPRNSSHIIELCRPEIPLLKEHETHLPKPQHRHPKLARSPKAYNSPSQYSTWFLFLISIIDVHRVTVSMLYGYVMGTHTTFDVELEKVRERVYSDLVRR